MALFGHSWRRVKFVDVQSFSRRQVVLPLWRRARGAFFFFTIRIYDSICRPWSLHGQEPDRRLVSHGALVCGCWESVFAAQRHAAPGDQARQDVGHIVKKSPGRSLGEARQIFPP